VSIMNSINAALAAKATDIKIKWPLGLGEVNFKVSDIEDAERKIAWKLYVELTTRIAVQRLADDEGLLREALVSLYKSFTEMRTILREADPVVANGPQSLGAVAVAVLNQGLRPFLAKWHPLLTDHEAQCPNGVGKRAHECAWNKTTEMRKALHDLQDEMGIYVDALAKIAGVVR